MINTLQEFTTPARRASEAVHFRASSPGLGRRMEVFGDRPPLGDRPPPAAQAGTLDALVCAEPPQLRSPTSAPRAKVTKRSPANHTRIFPLINLIMRM